MIKESFLCAILLLPTLPCSAQTGSEAAVQNVIIEMFDALANGDVEKVLEHCTADVKVLENAVVWNVDSLRVKILPGAGSNRVNSFQFLDTRVTEKTAWVSYVNRADVTFNNKKRMVRWLESAFLIKDSNQWKIQLLHSTVLERKAIE
jgi:hypothetical protein